MVDKAPSDPSSPCYRDPTGELRMIAAISPHGHLKSADPDRLAEVLARADKLARSHDPVKDDTALAAYGPADPVDWSIEAVRLLTAKP